MSFYFDSVEFDFSSRRGDRTGQILKRRNGMVILNHSSDERSPLDLVNVDRASFSRIDIHLTTDNIISYGIFSHTNDAKFDELRTRVMAFAKWSFVADAAS